MSDFKSRAARAAGQLLTSQAVISLLSNPKFQDAVKRAINVRGDVREGWESQIESLAKTFNLVTRADVKALKRSIRELENQTATLEYELKKQRERAERAEAAVEAAAAERAAAAKEAAAKKAAPKKAVAKKAAPKKAVAKKAAPKKAVAKKAAPKKAAAKKAAPKKK